MAGPACGICSNDDGFWIADAADRCRCEKSARIAAASELLVASGKMPSDLTIVIADVTRMAGIRSGLRLSGRVAYFAGSSLGAALEAIQTHGPRLVAIDAAIVQTQQGAGFIKRIENLAIPGCGIQLIIQANGAWKTAEREAQFSPDEAAAKGSAPSTSRPLAAAAAATNTRRAPRFPMLEAVNAAVEGGQATLVNISVLGAQLVSVPVLRPGQTVKIALPDANELLRLTANVAWSTFQQTGQGTAVYRAGVAFTDAARETLDDYCRRYGADSPLASY